MSGKNFEFFYVCGVEQNYDRVDNHNFTIYIENNSEGLL